MRGARQAAYALRAVCMRGVVDAAIIAPCHACHCLCLIHAAATPDEARYAADVILLICPAAIDADARIIAFSLCG